MARKPNANEAPSREFDDFAARLTPRQAEIYRLYKTQPQNVIAEQLGISRATVARDLAAIRSRDDLPEADSWVVATGSKRLTPTDFSELIEKGRHRSTAYRQAQKRDRTAPEHRDKVLHELKIAHRAIRRAVLAMADNGERETSDALKQLSWIAELVSDAKTRLGPHRV